MLKKTLAAAALAVGFAALVATPAAAEGPYDNIFTTEVTEHFVSAFDPAAYGSRSGDSMIISPFGTSQPIWCFSFHGQGSCWQTDPSGVDHTLGSVQIPTGSSAGSFRTIAIYNPF
ncbi:hypothetical protein E5720_16270 [Rhodococcus sp. PAMC28707]|nr:hypothetical protein E5769_19250 [Rhodococcus sp. PAMC28705]QCB61112.1 hypothetical protein E5720_16270 [Rhodococcus sp. PAMC28707]